MISTSISLTISDNAEIVESFAVGKNSQFHVTISMSLEFSVGTFQLSKFS